MAFATINKAASDRAAAALSEEPSDFHLGDCPRDAGRPARRRAEHRARGASTAMSPQGTARRRRSSGTARTAAAQLQLCRSGRANRAFRQCAGRARSGAGRPRLCAVRPGARTLHRRTRHAEGRAGLLARCSPPSAPSRSGCAWKSARRTCLSPTPRLYQHKIAPWRNEIPSLKLVLIIGDEAPDGCDGARPGDGGGLATGSTSRRPQPEDLALLHFTSRHHRPAEGRDPCASRPSSCTP